LIYLFIE